MFIVIFSFVIDSCDTNNTGIDTNTALYKYQSVGKSVAAKEWSQDYDCSNFSVQFYQNCFKAGLPCRVRIGDSGGHGFVKESHAWNSVFINGQWVDWEPQYNSIHYGHIKTSTLIGGRWGQTTSEDLSRIIYELIKAYTF